MNEIKSSKRVSAFIKQFIFMSCLFTAAAVLIGHSISVITAVPDTDTSADVSSSKMTVVIDPGHGGEDGGAVAADGTLEKTLNLEFAKTLQSTCKILGIDAVLTRDTDTLLYDKYSDLEDYTGKKKVYDLKNRLRFTEEIGENTIFVGIHMNKFSDSKYSGTQVYYSSNSQDSMTLAQGIQSKVKESLQPENNREIKKAGSSIFLLKRLEVPAILAECGFLSNEVETERLKNDEYKKEFSLTTAVAIGEFINTKEN